MKTHTATRALTLATFFGLGLALVATDAPSTAAQPRIDTSLQCVEDANQRTALIDAQLDTLCLGTPTPTGPVDCFVEARSLVLTDDQGISLCRCSPNNEPVACYRQVSATSLITQDEIIALCSPSLVRGLGPACR